MKLNMLFACLLLLYPTFSAPLHSGDSFKPWNADVTVTDENCNIKSISAPEITNVFSAPQGGAYFMIRAFQIFISPQDGPNCRYTPTCSAYGKIAVLKYGAIVGGFLAGDRLIRCNPYNQPGEDPVPDSILE